MISKFMFKVAHMTEHGVNFQNQNLKITFSSFLECLRNKYGSEAVIKFGALSQNFQLFFHLIV